MKQHPNKNETTHQDGNDDLIIDDFEMIPTQTIDLDPMMELRVEILWRHREILKNWKNKSTN